METHAGLVCQTRRGLRSQHGSAPDLGLVHMKSHLGRHMDRRFGRQTIAPGTHLLWSMPEQRGARLIFGRLLAGS